MKTMSDYKIVEHVPQHLVGQAAELHFQAFSGKIGGILGRDGRGEAFFADILDPAFGICAVSDDGHQLLGVAGYKTAQGSLIGGGLKDIMKHYGMFGGIWRGLLLSVLERDLEADVLLMDGIAVVPQMRSKGVGSALLDAVVNAAKEAGKSEVRLDVIDINPGARSLYERKGFVATDRQTMGPLKYIFGFSSSTTMLKSVEATPGGAKGAASKKPA